MTDIYSKVNDIIAEVYDEGVQRDFGVHIDLGDEFGLDSLDFAMIVIDLEDAYGIKLPYGLMDTSPTVSSIVNLVQKELAHGTP